jgi:transmembrane sensor
MDEVNDESDALDPLRRAAVDWVQRLASGRATVADAEALERWRRQSPAHAAAYAEASRLWQEFGPAARNLRQRGEISPGLAGADRSRQAVGRRAVFGGALAAASAAAACAVVRPPFGLWPSFAELTADYRTETGEQRQVSLPGDVSVRLNTQTSIALRSSGEDAHADRVELVAGEASFATVSGADRPLVVLAAGGRTIASAAGFDVRRTGPAVRVTCINGSVRVELRAHAAAIGPGQQIRYDETGLGSVVTVDPELVTAWQQGVLIFRLTPLAEVVDEINRYRPGKVILLNAALGRKRVSGRFRIDHMDEILVRLDQAFGAKSRALPGGIVLLS